MRRPVQTANRPGGEYLMKVMVPGFATYQKTLTLTAGSASTVNVNLAIGEILETVDIVSKRPQTATSAAATPQKIRVGGMVHQCNLISKVNPAYPATRRPRRGGHGDAKGNCFEDGSLLSVKSVSNGVDPRLVRQPWRRCLCGATSRRC